MPTTITITTATGCKITLSANATANRKLLGV
jgi:hypothetical protein